MRKVLLTSVFLAAGLPYPSASRADSVTLTSGEKLDGVISSDTAAGVTIEVKVAAGITDERTIPRAEIAKVDKTAPDDLAYAEIKNLKADAQTSFPVETYDHMLSALKNFQTKFPASPHNPDVQLDLDVLQKEKERVADGEMKYLGQWLSKEDVEKRGVQIQAFAQFAAMREQAARNDILGALMTFDQLEKTRANTRAYPEAVDLARGLLPRLQADIASRVKTLTFQQTQFQKEIAMNPEPKKTELINSYKREQAQFDAALAAATKNGAKWPPLFPRSAKSLDAIQKVAATETTRLAAVATPKMRESIALVDQAKAAMETNDLKGADSLLKQAVARWPQNEAAAYWAAKLKVQMTPAVTPAPTSSPSPSPTPRAVAPPAASANPSPSPVAKTAGPKSFFLTVPGALTIVGVVAAIIGGVTLVSKAKAANGASGE